MDKEKVISWLEGLAEDDWRECYSDSEVQETARQALNLIDELLQEQEAKEVEAEVINEIDRLYRCPSCHISMILRGQPYCHSCGQAVKWK